MDALRRRFPVSRWRLAAGLVLALTLAPRLAAAQPVLPTLTEPVHDLAGVIDATSKGELDRLIRLLQRATGDVVIVVTIRTYAPDYADIREYAVKLFENHGHGIGEKDKDNGVLVLLAVDDRKVWIEVGYGLEGAITDGFAGETSRLYMAPAFRKGEYGAGLLAGVTRLLSRIAEERQVDIADLPRLASERRPRTSDGGVPVGFIIAIVVVLLIIHWMQPRNRRGSRWTSGPTWGGSSWSGWSGGGSFGGGSFGGGFGGFGGGGSGGGGGGASW